MDTISISEELRTCILNMPDEERTLFEYYCLGKRSNMHYDSSESLDDYISLVSNFLKSGSYPSRSFVVFKSITMEDELVKREYWRDDYARKYGDCKLKMYFDRSLCNSYWSCYTCNASMYNFRSGVQRYHKTFESFAANPACVLFIHPSVKSVDTEELARFAELWCMHYFEISKIHPIPKFRFVYGNSKQMYTGNVPPTHKEKKKFKLNSDSLPIKTMIYEEL